MISLDSGQPPRVLTSTRIAVDIGSTVVKVARVGNDDQIVCQRFWPRDFEAGIARQVEAIIDEFAGPGDQPNILACSSANGGLRVGIVCLTKHFSGAVLRAQVLLAGANPIFVRDLDEDGGDLSRVDVLLVGGGINSREAAPLERRLRRFDPDNYRFGSMVYAGNECLAELFAGLFPACTVIPNPLVDGLSSRSNSVFETLRRAYLDDLIYKEGVSELRRDLAQTVRPTPEVVNSGFQRAVLNRSNIVVAGPSLLMDIGGATTDLHYTVEVIRDDSDIKPATGGSVARYVFTDLGIVASRDSLLLQLRSHPRLYEFLGVVLSADVREVYGLLREGEYRPSAELLSYACLFLALDRFSQGRGPGLPAADLGRVAQILLTGGAAQGLAESTVTRVVRLLVPGGMPTVFIDRRYQIWVDGITWPGHAVS